MEPKNNEAPAYLDLHQYVLNLMEELGAEGMEESKKNNFYNELMGQAGRRVMEAIVNSADPESLDETLEVDGHLKDIKEFVERWVERSPEAQLAIVNALDELRIEILGLIKR